jgi:hypothetical protein
MSGHTSGLTPEQIEEADRRLALLGGGNSFNRMDDQSVIIGYGPGRPGGPQNPIVLKGADAKDNFKNGLYSYNDSTWNTIDKLYSKWV